MRSSSCILLSCVAALAVAMPQFGGPPPSGAFPAMPPELKRILPADAVAKLEAIHSDMALNFVQKQQKIDEIMTTLPDEILDQIPPPPGFDRLPQEVKDSLKQINRSRDYSWEQKQEKLRELIQSLPSEQRRILAGPMGGR